MAYFQFDSLAGSCDILTEVSSEVGLLAASFPSLEVLQIVSCYTFGSAALVFSEVYVNANPHRTQILLYLYLWFCWSIPLSPGYSFSLLKMSKTTPEKHSIPGNDCGRDWRHPKGFCCALGAYSNSNIANKSGVAEQLQNDKLELLVILFFFLNGVSEAIFSVGNRQRLCTSLMLTRIRWIRVGMVPIQAPFA